MIIPPVIHAAHIAQVTYSLHALGVYLDIPDATSVPFRSARNFMMEKITGVMIST